MNTPRARLITGYSSVSRQKLIEAARDRLLKAAKNADILVVKSELREFSEVAESGTWTDFPGYADLEINSHEPDELVALFFDLRKSTDTMREIGAEGTYALSMALLPGLAELVLHFNGFVVDYPGDGLMALWGFEGNGVKPRINDSICNSVDCAYAMSKFVEGLNDEVFSRAHLQFKTETYRSKIPPIRFGIGISHGPVIVTKVGVEGKPFVQAKAIGPCVHEASKLSNGLVDQFDTILLAEPTRSVFRPVKDGDAKYSFDQRVNHKLDKVKLDPKLGFV